MDSIKNHNIDNTNPSSQVILDLINHYELAQYNMAESKALSITKEFPEHQLSWKVLAAVFIKKNKNHEALKANKEALKLNPQDSEVFNNLGLTLQKLGKFNESENNLKKAISLKPNFAQAYFNLGITLKALGRLIDAEKSFKTALHYQPNYAQAFNNLGTLLKEMGQLEDAVVSYTKAIALKPDYVEAHTNLGVILKELGQLEDAEKKIRKAIDLNNNYPEAYNNLGAILNELGNFDEAEFAYKKAIGLNPKYSKAYNNLGCIMYEKGKIKEGWNIIAKVIQKDPKFNMAWENLYFSSQILISDGRQCKNFLPFNKKFTESYKRKISILEYKLYRGSKYEKYFLKKAINIISKNKNLVLENPVTPKFKKSVVRGFPKKVIALLHYGRSGTGLLHSLIDNHKEVSTFPSIYLSQFFDGENWSKIISDGWQGVIERFIQKYPVFFDARSPYPVPSIGMSSVESLGIKEGMTTLGNNKDEFLFLEKKIFRKEMEYLVSQYHSLDQITFFKLAHIAYEKTLNKLQNKKIILYHIHNPDTYAKLNFIQAVPNCNWIVMVRDPVISCESWISECFKNNLYKEISTRISRMLFDIDDVVFKEKEAIGIRLEDLKKKPIDTMSSLCRWIGINQEDSLYNMTAQGKKWWGDLGFQSKPAFEKKIKSNMYKVFSRNDKFILNTLFYPFRVSFGYAKEDHKKFKADLKIIRPMIDDVFDFEKKLIQITKEKKEAFKRSGHFLYLRSRLLNRWKVLNKNHTYPNLLKPLKINQYNK